MLEQGTYVPPTPLCDLKAGIEAAQALLENGCDQASQKNLIQWVREATGMLTLIQSKYTFAEYQDACRRTMPQGQSFPDALANMALGIAGEAGECADVAKKWLYHHKDPDAMRDHLLEEMGDVLWYLGAMCQALGTSMETVARDNIEKLRKRWPNGFPTNDEGIR